MWFPPPSCDCVVSHSHLCPLVVVPPLLFFLVCVCVCVSACVGVCWCVQLFRHFIRGPDGTIAEVFTEEDMTSPENYHKSLTEWSPQNIDYWMHRVAPNMMEELKAAADEVDDIMPLEQVELDGIESELSHSDDEYSFVN